MKTINIIVDGKKYPARETMGAMLDFKKITGHEADTLTDGNISEFGTFIYCCVKSACRKDKIEFPYSLEDFCDSIDADVVNEWTTALLQAQEAANAEAGDSDDGDKKK